MAEEPEDEELEAYLRSSLSDRRRSRWGRQSLRRGSSPFLTEGLIGKHRRRLSSFTTSSGDDTAISIDEEATEEEVRENMRMNKQIMETIKLQPWRMKKKYRILRKAKAYVRKHEGELAQSKRSKDVFAKYTLLWNRGWNRFKREVANFMVSLTPWEMRIKRIESHFGSVVASYFTFLRWVFWINCFISAFVCCFLMVPEVLRGANDPTGMRKELESNEAQSALNLKAIWDFEGYLKYSPIFYGYYSNQEKTEEGYRVPLAYFLTSLSVYIFSFFAILRRMAENSRMSKLSEKDDECTFAWKLFTGWDYMIGNPETAYNKVASLVMGFKEAILEEKEKKKEAKSWKLIAIRVAANFFVLLLLASSAYAVVLVVQRSQEPEAEESWYRQNEVTLVVSFISILFPNLFDLIGIAEQYHPRVQLRWQLARILLLYLLNLYTLIFALFVKVYKMTDALSALAFNITSQSAMNQDAMVELTNNSASSPARHLLSITLSDDDPTLQESTNCTLIVIHNCTLALMNSTAGLNLTELLATTLSPAFLGNVSIDGDYFFGNSSEVDSGYDSIFWSIANLTAFGVANWSAVSSGPHVAFPPVFLNNYSSVDTLTGGGSGFAWDGSLDYTDELADIFANWSFTLRTLMSNDSTSTVSPTLAGLMTIPPWMTNGTNSTENGPQTSTESDTETAWPSELNCTVVIPVCPTPPVPTGDGTEYASTTESTDSTTLQGTDGEESNGTTNATDVAGEATVVPCVGSSCMVKKRREPPCPLHCKSKDDKSRKVVSPTVDELVQVEEAVKEELRKLCWETMFGQELVKLTVMDLVMTVITTILTDFIRAVFVRYANQCWCWDLEKGFPGYGDFKIAENILHLVNNQGMVWMGMFFSPGLPAINSAKLCILVYVRSWAVLTANIPHETVFRASRSNNFYYALLLIMLFLCTLPVGFACVWLEPSWHCGPFSHYDRIYKVLTNYVLASLPPFMYQVVDYMTSPGVVIPLLLLLILIIYYLTSLTGSLREANNDLKMQLRREKNEKEKSVDEKPPEPEVVPDDPNTKWSSAKKVLPVLPNKFRSCNHLHGDDLDDDEDHVATTPSRKPGKRVQYTVMSEDEEQSDDQLEIGHEDTRATRGDDTQHKKRRMQRPSPLSVESLKSSNGDESQWRRRRRGNGEVPLITISQASEGRDSPGMLSSLLSSDDASPSSTSSRLRRTHLIPSVSEEEEEEEEDAEPVPVVKEKGLLEDDGEDEDDDIPARMEKSLLDDDEDEDTPPVREKGLLEDDEEEEEEDEEDDDDIHHKQTLDIKDVVLRDKEEKSPFLPEHSENKMNQDKEHEEMKDLGKRSRQHPRQSTLETTLSDEDYDEMSKKATLPIGEAHATLGTPAKGSLQRSKAIKSGDSTGSTDSGTGKPPSPDADIKLAKIQRLDTDSL